MHRQAVADGGVQASARARQSSEQLRPGLREALDDSAENPKFVETLPRRGYRFIAPVEAVHGGTSQRLAANVVRTTSWVRMMSVAGWRRYGRSDRNAGGQLPTRIVAARGTRGRRDPIACRPAVRQPHWRSRAAVPSDSSMATLSATSSVGDPTTSTPVTETVVVP
jgi:hypothetical protein